MRKTAILPFFLFFFSCADDVPKEKSKSPLYVVDGTITTRIDSILPEQIKRVDVFKDSLALAIYGADGKNGVIVITTK